MPLRRLLFLLPLLAFAALAVWFAAGLGRDPHLVPSALIDKPVPNFALPPLPGFEHGLATADLASGIPIALTVVDAVRILRDNGPTGGNLNDVQKIDTIIASADVVAADSYAATLLGLRPNDVAYIKAAVAMGLGRSDLAVMKIEEIKVGG